MSATIQGLQFGKDPLDDPIVAEWDAVVGIGPLPDPDWVPDRVELLRQFHALDDVPMPSPTFFDGLEQRLAGMAVAQLAPELRATAQDVANPYAGRPPRIALSRDRGMRPPRWMPIPAAAAVLAFVALAGLLVLYRAVPPPSEPSAIPAAEIAQPEFQTVMQFNFVPPLLNVPDATTWGLMFFGIFELGPGESFDTNGGWWSGIGGPSLVTVMSGELEMAPRGPSIVYPADRAEKPSQIDPGQTVWLGPNDSIVYSTADTVVVTNSGRALATVGIGTAGATDSDAPVTILPAVLTQVDWHYLDSIPAIPTAGATVSIQRLELLPYDSYVLDPGKDLRYLPVFRGGYFRGLSMADGAVDGWTPGLKTRRVAESNGLRFLGSEPVTLFNLGEEPIDIYFFVVEPNPAPATPTP